MCGNDISTVIAPEGGWYKEVSSQIPTGQLRLKKYNVTLSDAISFQSMHTEKLKEIEFMQCNITHDILNELLKSRLNNLQRLSLNKNRIGPSGCRMIATSPGLKNLQALEVNDNKIKDTGLKALAEGFTKNLQDLSINDNQITTDGIKYLQKFKRVQYLNTAGNRLNDDSIPVIKGLNKKIKFLCLSRNQFTDKALQPFIQFRELQVLMLDRNFITVNKKELAVPENLFVFY